MTYIGITPTGKNVKLPNPVQVRLNRAEGAPADGFTGVFPMGRTAGNLTGIHIYDKNQELCFDGIVDEQKESCGSEMMLTIIARSSAALLLDNEAIPQTYNMMSLPMIFARHVLTYGFSSFLGSKKLFPGELAVTKGMSDWQAAELFCTKYLNVKPRIQNGVFDASGIRPQGEIIFDNTNGVRYSSLTAENKYSSLLSELLMQQNSNGSYSPIMRDESAVALGIRRRRCLTAGQNAGTVIRASQCKAFDVKADCPGEIPAQLLQNASVQDKILGTIGNLYISEIDYILNSGGETTRFTLRRLASCGFQGK